MFSRGVRGVHEIERVARGTKRKKKTTIRRVSRREQTKKEKRRAEGRVRDANDRGRKIEYTKRNGGSGKKLEVCRPHYLEERAGKSCFSSSYGWIEGAEGGWVAKREKQRGGSSKKEEVIQPRRVYESRVSLGEERVSCRQTRVRERDSAVCRV